MYVMRYQIQNSLFLFKFIVKLLFSVLETGSKRNRLVSFWLIFRYFVQTRIQPVHTNSISLSLPMEPTIFQNSYVYFWFCL